MLVVVGVVLLWGTFETLDVTEQTQSTAAQDSWTGAPRRRYSTSDEMQYILYGVEGSRQFSLYDEQLLDYIRSRISQPSVTRPRQLAQRQKKDASEYGQSTFVDKLLSGRRGGFFIECGAADGETYSNSLFFELERNWTGLLIEANSDYHRKLLEKNRRAYVLNACLSTERRPTTVRFAPAGLLGGILEKMHPAHVAGMGSSKEPQVTLNCFPLSSITAALGVSHIDYLSLDVEGPEIEILKTVDWTRLQIEIISLEYRVYGENMVGQHRPGTMQRLKDMRTFFRDTGVYREVGLIPSVSVEDDGIDVIFSRV